MRSGPGRERPRKPDVLETARGLGADTAKCQLRVGALWLVLSVVFEISLGTAIGYTRERTLSDYNPAQGGLMGLGLVCMLFAPLLGAKRSGMGRRSPENPQQAGGRRGPRP